jgi:O-methyltransferase
MLNQIAQLRTLLRRRGIRKRDLSACTSFLCNTELNISSYEKMRILKCLYRVSFSIASPHTQSDILAYVQTILQVPPSSKGVVVEAGCYKGASTAKFSVAADIANRELVVFDSFEGIPENNERGSTSGLVRFKKGDYCGTLGEVKENVSRFGKITRCRFISGWFDDTMPQFKEPIAAIYLDVDLVSSTRTCLKYLYPCLEPGGVLYSHDGHLPLVTEALGNDVFWLSEVGHKKPRILGLGTSKLIKIVKDP